MPRLVQSLKQQVIRIFDERIEDSNKVASRIANAYQAYCQSASGPLGDPVILKGIEYKGFEANLASLMSGQAPSPQASGLIVQALTAFWLAPPVLTSGGGVCASIVPAAAQAKMVSTKADTAAKAAGSLADSLHLMTSTVFVVYPYPIPPGLLL
jgi:hypothetical protein